MTIDEAIKQRRDFIKFAKIDMAEAEHKQQIELIDKSIRNNYQLIEWLEELKTLRTEKERWDDQIVNLSKNVESAYKQRDKMVAEKERVIAELEEKRDEILNSNDYENEIINYCLDNFDYAIAINKGIEALKLIEKLEDDVK